MITTDRQQELFANHLDFLAAHRGRVRSTEDAVEVRSDRPEYTYAVPQEKTDLRALAAEFSALHFAPWAQRHRDAAASLGFKPKSGLSYMELGADHRAWPLLSGLEVSLARDAGEMAVFSEVQARGFLESDAAYASWAPWLAAANARNLGRPDQRFYVGRLAKEPAGVVLTVSTGAVTGIYAVATRPEFRKKGVSTALMKRAIDDAKSAGSPVITLQVLRGSYAEAFYKKLGFTTAFEVDVLGR